MTSKRILFGASGGCACSDEIKARPCASPRPTADDEMAKRAVRMLDWYALVPHGVVRDKVAQGHPRLTWEVGLNDQKQAATDRLHVPEDMARVTPAIEIPRSSCGRSGLADRGYPAPGGAGHSGSDIGPSSTPHSEPQRRHAKLGRFQTGGSCRLISCGCQAVDRPDFRCDLNRHSIVVRMTDQPGRSAVPHDACLGRPVRKFGLLIQSNAWPL